MGKTSNYGQYGTMNEDMYLKKMEATCMFEDDNQVENFMRESLIDMRPDPTFFESDAARTNNYSEDRLNLRHCGKRVEAEPYLPDGTFLDFDGLNSDSRGSAIDPNMMLHRKQQEARGKFVKFSNDADNSVVSEGRSQTKVIRDIKGQFYNVKNRLKIFDESMNGFSTSGLTHKERNMVNNGQLIQQIDDRKPEMQDESYFNRGGRVNDLSMNTSIGWRRTTDHRFKTAQYGQVRTVGNPNKQNVLKNRSNTYIEHDVLVSWKDQNVPKSVSIKMIDIAKQKKRDMDAAGNIEFNQSQQFQNGRARKVTLSDLIGVRQAAKESQGQTAHNALRGEQSSHVTGAMMKPHLDSNKIAKVVIDPVIVTYMASVNRNFTKQRTDDLREKVLQSSEFTGLLVNQSNKSASNVEITNKLLWESIANYDKGVSMKVTNYSQLTGGIRPKDQNMLAFEAYKQSQKTSGQKHGILRPSDMYTMESVDYDQDYNSPEITDVKLCGPMKGKRMRKFMDRGDTDNTELSDVTARN